MRKIDWNEKTRIFSNEIAQEEDSEAWLAALIEPSYSISKKNMFQLLIRQGKLIFLEPNGLCPFLLFSGAISHRRFKWELEKGIRNCTKSNFKHILKKIGAVEVEIKPIAYFPVFITNKFPSMTLFIENVLKHAPIVSNLSTGLMVKAIKD